MATLRLENIVKRFHTLNEDTIKNFSLDVKSGELVVFVGPSGCGKSTLLRMIAGLEDPTSGKISLEGSDITDIRPSRRNMAMVFQSYALYPHMNVRENMAFALKLAKIAPNVITERVEKAAAMLNLTAYLETKPKHLSGGQRQRVAIGRAIVREPQLFLFDEPLSNLDAALRVQTRIEISLLHKRLKTTMIYVTHDQIEAMTLASRIVVLNNGTLEQVGTPTEIYHNPDNVFVAGFIGTPKMNFFQATLSRMENRALTLKVADQQTIEIGRDFTEVASSLKVGAPIILGVRPEHLEVISNPKATAVKNKPTLTATVDIIENLGSTSYLYGTIHSHPMANKTQSETKENAKIKEHSKIKTTSLAKENPKSIDPMLAETRTHALPGLENQISNQNAITVRLTGDPATLAGRDSVSVVLDPERVYLFNGEGKNIFSKVRS
ncbi:ABC transporter ATP-binding protein [Spirochaetota bacterium]|nr:ABC transporter ATP-binding protein [Spirochaetota bacterium]